MAKTTVAFTNFTAGELSPRLDGRTDLGKYFNGCKTLENMVVHPHGAASRRPGTKFVHEVKTSSAQTRLIPFEFSTTQTYILEFGNSYIRFFKDNGIASIQVDSHGPRKLTRRTAVRTVCSGVDLQGQERAGDIYSVLKNLNKFHWIDEENLYVAGWSHGAYSLMDFMTMQDKLTPTNIIDFDESMIPSIKGMITFYPHCGILNLSQNNKWRTKTPSLVFLADLDGFGLATQPEDCIELFNSMNETDHFVDYYLMENTTHVFDSEFFIRRAIKYNKKATDFAKNKILSFIKSSGSKVN